MPASARGSGALLISRRELSWPSKFFVYCSCNPSVNDNPVFRRNRRFGRRTVAFWGSGGRRRSYKPRSKSYRSRSTYEISSEPALAPNPGDQNRDLQTPLPEVVAADMPWEERYKAIRSSRASARCREGSILLGVCSGLVARAVHNKLTRTVEVRQNPEKYLIITRLKFLLLSLLFGYGIIAYVLFIITEKEFATWSAFDDVYVLTDEEKDEAREYGWSID